MPGWVLNKIAQALYERGRAIKASRILVLKQDCVVLVTDHAAFD